MLMAAVVCGLGMCVISCSDDDDNSGKSEEQKEQEAQQKASKFWDVVGQLVADHGLAIALEDLDKGNVKTYEMATNTDSLNKWTQNINVAGGKWRLPAPTDWSYLLIGLYSDKTTLSSDAINNMLGSYNNSSMLTSTYWTDNMSYMKFDQTTKQAVGIGLTSASIYNIENRYKIRLVLRF